MKNKKIKIKYLKVNSKKKTLLTIATILGEMKYLFLLKTIKIHPTILIYVYFIFSFLFVVQIFAWIFG